MAGDRNCGRVKTASRYAFASAENLYRRNVHPRVMLGPDDVVELRRQIQRGDGKKIMAALRKKVRTLVDFVIESEDLATMLKGDGSHNSPAARVGYAIDDMAMVAALDQDADTLSAVKQLFSVVCSPNYEGGRIGVVGLGLSYDLLHDHLSVSERRAYLRAAQPAIRQAISSTPAYYKSSGANMPLGMALSAVPALLAIAGDPGVRNLDRELAELVTRLEATLHTAINPDGYPEEDIGYGTSVAAWLTQIAEGLRRAGVYDAYENCERFSRFGRAMLHFVEPWGEDLANTGDHGDDFGHREFVLARLAAETNDPTLLWLLGTLHYHHGKVHPENTLPDFWVEVPLRKGFRTPATGTSLLVLNEMKGEKYPAKAKTPTQFCDRGRGIVSCRSGWGPDDTFVVFDGSQRSPSAQGHCHDSCGDFLLSAVGEYFAIGTGRYNVEQDCHSVVLIDGKSGRSTDGEWRQSYYHGNLIAYTPGEFCDFAAADSSHQHDCYWARRYLGLVKGQGARGYVWTVDDLNKANDWAEYWWQLQSSPENTIATRRRSATIRGWRHGNLLDVHFAIPAPHEYPEAHTLTVAQDLGVSSSHKYLKTDPSNNLGKFGGPADHVRRYSRPADMVHGPSYVRPRLLGKVSGYNGRFMSIMLPREKGEKAAKVARLKAIDNSLAVRLSFPEVEDTLIFAYEHSLLEADGVVGRGQWCVVRRSRSTRKVVAWEIGQGTSLTVDGKRLLSPG